MYIFPIDNPTYYEQPVTKHGDNQQQFPSIEAPQKQTVVLQTRHQYELQTNAEGEHNYEMEDGPQPGHVYEMSNFEQLINARDGYPYTSGYEIHEVFIIFSTVLWYSIHTNIVITLHS